MCVHTVMIAVVLCCDVVGLVLVFMGEKTEPHRGKETLQVIQPVGADLVSSPGF